MDEVTPEQAVKHAALMFMHEVDEAFSPDEDTHEHVIRAGKHLRAALKRQGA